MANQENAAELSSCFCYLSEGEMARRRFLSACCCSANSASGSRCAARKIAFLLLRLWDSKYNEGPTKPRLYKKLWNKRWVNGWVAATPYEVLVCKVHQRVRTQPREEQATVLVVVLVVCSMTSPYLTIGKLSSPLSDRFAANNKAWIDLALGKSKSWCDSSERYKVESSGI